MTIIRNTFTPNTPYYSSHIPLQLNGDEAIVTSIDDMVSYSVLPALNGTIINQPFGVENLFNFSIRIINLTKNVSLQIELLAQELLLEANRTNKFILRPTETRDMLIAIDENRFNAIGGEASIEELIQLKIENLDNGTYALRNITLQPITKTRLPDEIDIE
jgi:hypothetical protein